jgi:DNA-binding NarL/FixJ family response regulator
MLKEIPVVVFTGAEAPGMFDRAFALGARRCLFKTSDVNAWIEIIHSLAEELLLYPIISMTGDSTETRKAA